MLRVDQVFGLLLLFFVLGSILPTFVFSQEREFRGERIVLDDDGSDGTVNKVVIHPDSLPANATIVIPHPGTDTAKFILSESMVPQTINADLIFTGTVNLTEASLVGTAAVLTNSSLVGNGTLGNVLGLNLAHSNTWTALQNFAGINASGTITAATLTDGTASLAGGIFDFGTGANDDLTAIDVIDLTDGGTSTLHNHNDLYYTKTELGSPLTGLGASLIGIEDAGASFTATTVEGALVELAASTSGAGEPFITVAPSGALSAERALTAGTGVSLNDGGANGNMTISIGQDVGTSATPTFDGVTLDNMTGGSTSTDVVVSNGGTLQTRTAGSLIGASTLTEDNIWVGNATNNPAELAPGTDGQVLQINGTTPTWQSINLLPTGTTDNATLVWDVGTSEWVENASVTLDAATGDITTTGDVNAVDVTTSGDLTVSGTQATLPNGSVSNAELQNSSVGVAYGTGLSGDASVSLGGTLNLQNTGVTSLAGTTNQVSVSASTGGVTLSLPQNIHNNATPTFDGVTLDNMTSGSTSTDVVVSNGGTLQTRTAGSLIGASTLTEDNIWVGNATNNPAELAPGTDGQVLQIAGTTPTWQSLNLLPTGTTDNAALVWDAGTAEWVENTNVTLDVATGDIATSGDATIGGDLTVSGTQATLPNGSVSNAELQNSSVSVAYGAGLSGDASVSLGGTLNLQNTGVTGTVAGTGIGVSGATGNVTISNTGVTSLAGTTNQVSVSASTGAVTLSLPQNIHNNATPTFDGVTLDNMTNGSISTDVVVSNGGTLQTRTAGSLIGASTLTEDNIWVGNVTNNPAELAPGTDGQVLQIAGTTPTWQSINLLPMGTTDNATLVWDAGTAEWVENTNVTLDATTGDIATSGDATIGGDLTVSGTQATLPNGSVSNAELQNSSVGVAYGTGLSGDASVSLGGTLNLQNTGVTSLAGTTNQVSVSASTGAVTLSLPQNIHNNATPTFDGVTLDNMTSGSTSTDVVVSNGGTLQTRTAGSLIGASTLTEDNIWVGNATNNPAELAPGTDGQVLQINGTTPTWQSLNLLPTGTTDNATLVWDAGTAEWVENTNVTLDATNGAIATSGDATIGGDLTVSGTQAILPNGSVSNAELQNSSVGVAYGTGLSGDASVSLGGTLNLQNTGVTSLAGTTNQVSVSASTGAVTLSLPQNIHNNATPTFDGVTLDNMTGGSTSTDVVVSNGGTLQTRTAGSLIGASTLTEDNIWVGNATNNPAELAPGTDGQVLQINGTTPTWQSLNLLPTGTTDNAALVWDAGTAEWVENTNVTLDVATGDITASGDATIGGDLTVSGTQATLPNGSVSNAELQNSSVGVAYGTGLSGDALVSLGGTLNLQNTGVTSLAGTTNQVSVSGATGAVTLSLPQNIHNNATPTFDGVTLDNMTSGSTATNVVVSNGGVLETRTAGSLIGASTLTEDNIWVGNAMNNPAELAPGTDGQVLQINGTTPTWQSLNLLPTGTTDNATLVWDAGTSEWVENTNVTLDATNGAIATSGDATIGGDLTVSGTQAILPNGSVSNAELQNSSVGVAYGTGLSGDVSVSLGGTLNLQNTGVTSLAGTTNQVSVSASTGAVTLSLPQNIHNNATPTFDGVTLDNMTNGSTSTDVVVSNGGTLQTRTAGSLIGASTLTEDNIWVGNATNNPAELAPGTDGQVLQIAGTTPTWQSINLLPTGTTDNATLVWDAGTAEWVENTNVTLDVATGDVTTSGDATIGGDLTVSGTQAILPNGSVSNAELQNSSVGVAYGTGLSGDASVSLGGTLNLQNTGVTGTVAGTGIGVSGATGNVTISNTGVTSLAGTTNQVNVSASTGAVTLSLPQNIHNNATPTFDGVTLDNMTSGSTSTDVVVSNGGTLQTRTAGSLIGASTLTEDNIWVGNATNNPAELAPGTDGQVLQIAGTTPTWQSLNLLPTGTTDNATLVWDAGTSEWVENANVTLDATSGDITTTGDVNAVDVATSGDATIGGDLTVSGTQATLPNGSVSNAELQNSSVNLTYGTGVSGGSSVALGGTLNLQNTGVTGTVAGTGIGVSGATGNVTISNTGVTSLAGTTNQVSVSASTGAVTLSLPQNIHNNATPTFDGVTLDNMTSGSTATNVVVSNGGTLQTRTASSLIGASTLTKDNIWVGNATNNPSELPPGGNGQVLQIVGTAPAWQTLNLLPTGTVTNATLRWSGTAWVQNANMTADATGNTTVGGNLTVSGTQATLPNGSVSNAELQNSSINLTYGTGVSGGSSVALGGTLNLQNTGVTGTVAGTGIGVSGATGNVTISNTGVTSLAGTANQVSVSGATGAVTLSLPQNIHNNATPTFDGVTLDNMTSGSTSTNVVVSNGGTLQTRTASSLIGASTLTQDNIWVGNATNNPSALPPGGNGQVLRIVGTTPTWQTVNLLPTGTTDNATLVWDAGTSAWIENANVTIDAASGDITTGGDLSVGELTTSNQATIGGNLTVNGTQATLPNGSVSNAELQNSSISLTYGTGVSGGSSVSLGGTLNLQNTGVTSAVAGTGINVSGATGAVTITNSGVTGVTAGSGIGLSGGTGNVTITNSGVRTLTGTTNQVNVSASTGAVTLSTPQNIHTGASPTFAGLSLTGNLGITSGNISITTAGSISTASGNISTTSGSITASSGNLVAGNGGELRLTEPGGSNYSAFKAGAQSGDITYTLPATNGSAGAFLRIAASPAPTTTAATLEWSTASGLSTIGGIAFARKTANEGSVGSATPTLQNDDHLTAALNANQTYEIEGVLYVTTTEGAHDFRFALTAPTGSTIKVGYDGEQVASNTDRENNILTASGTNSTDINLVSANGSIVFLKGLIRTAGTSGSVTLQWCNTGSNTGQTVTLATDSYIKVTRVQ